MLLLIGYLIKSLATSVDRAFEGFFTCVRPQMVEKTLWLFEKFTTIGMIARIHSSLPLSIRVGIAKESELSE
jgi:hypothetical protein